MDEELEYVTGASYESLPPHSIACLMLGVLPPRTEPDLSRPSGNPPPMPRDVLDLVDPKSGGVITNEST